MVVLRLGGGIPQWGWMTPFSCFIIGETTLSIRCAEVLLARGHHVRGVISGNAEVVRWGRTRTVPVFDPSNDLCATLTETHYDFLFSIVNERILPPAVTTSPRRLAINYHDAPLPRYAGMHATSWALMNHETVHAISWHVASEVVDAGDVLVQRSVPIEPDDTALSLNAKCYEAAAEAFVELTEALEHGDPPRQPQDLSRRTYFGRYDRPAAAAILDWRRPVADLSALARALDFGPYFNPLGRPKLLLDGRVVACRTVTRAPTDSGLAPGTIVDVGTDSLTIAAAHGDALVRRICALDGSDLAPGTLSRELGLRSGMTLPPLSDEVAAGVSAIDARAARSESRWITRLATARGAASPFSRESPTVGQQRWHRFEVAVPAAFTEIASESDAGRDLATRLVAAVAVYVSRLSRERDLDIGLRLPDIAKSALAQLFATVVPVRLRVERADSFGVLVEHVAAALDQTRRLGTYARDLPSRHPVLRDRDGAPRYPIQIQLEGEPDLSAAEPTDVPDLHIAVRGDGAAFALSCRDGAVSADDTARIATHLEALVAGVATAPETPVGRLPLVSDSERHRLTEEWNATTAPYPRHLTIHELIEAQVKRSPNAVAVTDGRTSITYCQLDNLAEAVALRLRTAGVEPGTRVGVFAGRSAALVVAILGVLKSGGAYVPLDVEYPADRLRFMIDDASLATFVVEANVGSCPAPDDSTVIELDASGALTSDAPVGMPEAVRQAGPDDIAYVIYTSGSTGRPKGVLIPHRGVVNYLTWATAAYQTDTGAGAPLHSSPAFDLTVTALFAPLISGTPIQLVDQSLGPDALAAALRERPGCSLVKITPAHLTLLGQQLTPGEAEVATNAFVIGGENLTGEALEFWRRHAPATALFNEYGPTETVVGCCVYQVQKDDRFPGSVPIGRPIANTRLYVLDENRELLPIGIAGELYVGGDGVGAGYLGRRELTAERFVPDPFAHHPGARMYRTGDLVRYRTDGVLEFLGRLDDQVKVRGYRIELGEVEAVLAALPGVRSAAVVVREYGPGDQRLVGYFVPEEESAVQGIALRAELERVLPQYMVPASLVPLEALPLTANGKVDRKALPRPELRKPHEHVESDGPRGDVERAIAAIWHEALRVEHLSRTDDFFELGGHSLLLQRVRVAIKERTGYVVSTADMFRNPTIAGLADVIARAPAPGAGDPGQARVPRERPPMPLGKIFRRFFIPSFVVTLYYWVRDRARVSPRAEVEISPLLTFGRGSVVGSFTKIKAADGPLRFGKRCGIANSCFIASGPGGLHIGDHFGCGPNVSIVASSFVWERTGIAPSDQGVSSLGIRIGNNVWLGSNVTVLDGAVIGDDTIVSAGSVVEGKYPPRVVLRGNPAEIIAHR